MCADAMVPGLESQKKGRDLKWEDSAGGAGLHSPTCTDNQQTTATTSAGCVQNRR